MGLGNHPILKFDLSNISHLWRRCSLQAILGREPKKAAANDRDGTGHRKFSVLVLFIVLHTFLCIIILSFAMDR